MSPLLFDYEVEKLTDSGKIEYYEDGDLVDTIYDARPEEEYRELFSDFNKNFLRSRVKYTDGKYDNNDKLDFYNQNIDFFLNQDVFEEITSKENISDKVNTEIVSSKPLKREDYLESIIEFYVEGTDKKDVGIGTVIDELFGKQIRVSRWRFFGYVYDQVLLKTSKIGKELIKSKSLDEVRLVLNNALGKNRLGEWNSFNNDKHLIPKPIRVDQKDFKDIDKIALVDSFLKKVEYKTKVLPTTLVEILEIFEYNDIYPDEIIESLEGEELDRYKIAFINEVYFGNINDEYMWEYLENRRYEQRSEFIDYFNSGEEKSNSGDYQGAIEDYTKAIEIEPENYESNVNRGEAKGWNGDIEGAIIDYTKAIEIKPEYEGGYLLRGNTKQSFGDLNGACEDWKKAAELGNEDAAEKLKENCGDSNNSNEIDYVSSAEKKQSSGDYKGAIQDWEKIINTESDDYNLDVIYHNLGICLASIDEYQRAIDCYTKAIELNPKDSDSYLNRGIVKWNLAVEVDDDEKDEQLSSEAVLDFKKSSELGNELAKQQLNKVEESLRKVARSDSKDAEDCARFLKEHFD